MGSILYFPTSQNMLPPSTPDTLKKLNENLVRIRELISFDKLTVDDSNTRKAIIDMINLSISLNVIREKNLAELSELYCIIFNYFLFLIPKYLEIFEYDFASSEEKEFADAIRRWYNVNTKK